MISNQIQKIRVGTGNSNGIVTNSKTIQIGNGNPIINYEKNTSGIAKSVSVIRN